MRLDLYQAEGVCLRACPPTVLQKTFGGFFAMRISEEEQQAILNTITKFDQDAEVYLFGSRLDDAKKGGDIDILIASNVITKRMLGVLEDELFRQIDAQKLDFVLTDKEIRSAFARMVLARGAVKLWQKKN